MQDAAEIAFASKSLEDLSIPYDVNVNPLTGAAEISAGIAVTPSRSDFQPNLSLNYNSSSGNTKPLSTSIPSRVDNQWLFELVLDYGEHQTGVIPVHDSSAEHWAARIDQFSNHQAGFEVRSYRLCSGLLLFHQFEELGDGPTLASALTFEHDENAIASTIKNIQYVGFRRESDSYVSKLLPPLTFNYTQAELGHAFMVSAQTHENLPIGIGSTNYSWVDFYGEELPGVLYEGNQAWWFKPNLSEGRFGQQHVIAQTPSTNLSEYAFSDFDGNDNFNLAMTAGGHDAKPI